MEIKITSTEKITLVGNVSVRVWEGVSESGVKCFVFVHRIAVREEADTAQFDKDLAEQLPPGQFIPLRMIL